MLHSGEFGAIELDRDSAVRRIRQAVQERAAERPELSEPAGRVLDWLDGTDRGELLPWREFATVLAALELDLGV